MFTNRTPDIGVGHSFGTFQLGANVGTYATVTAAFPAGPNVALVLAANSGVPQQDDSLHVGQLADLEYKAHVAPGECALFFAVGASYNENRIVDPFDVLVWTHILLANADAELEVQLLPGLSLDLGVQLEVPVDASAELVTRTTFSTSAALMGTVAHGWDLYASGAVYDLGTYRLPFVAFGFAKRWGG